MKKILFIIYLGLIINTKSTSQDSIKFVLVKDLKTTGGDPYNIASNPHSFTICNGKLFFVALGDSVGEEIFISDGTPKGTYLLKNINTNHQFVSSESDNSSYPQHLYAFQNRLFFSADDNEYGGELWSSDGTKDGTELFKDINIGENSSGPREFIELNGKLLFFAESKGIQLYISDGLNLGTKIVKEFLGATFDGGIGGVYNNKYFYNYCNSGSFNRELWCSDGTENETKMIKDIKSIGGASPCNFIEYNNKLFFSAEGDSLGRELWYTDGTEANTLLYKNINKKKGVGSYPSELTILNNMLFFKASDSIHGNELWCLNKDSLYMIKDINSNEGALDYSYFHVFNNKLFFSAKSEGSTFPSLWTSDGTEQGTFELLASDSSKIAYPMAFVNWDSNLVSCHALIDGYSFLSFILASFELNLHSIVHSLLFL